VKALIATSFPEFRRAIASLLRANFEALVIGEAKTGDAAMAMLPAKLWDIAIIGIRLPVGGGLHFLKLIKAERPELPVIIVCYEAEPIAVGPAMAAGAAGYVMAPALTEDLVPSVRAALAGEVYPSTVLARWSKPDDTPSG
jgi:DNA-binding NarL/FixJ family response regulator